MSRLTLYGLPNCNTCRQAIKWLDHYALPYSFVDYRAQPVAVSMLKAWATQLGGWEKLINKSSTTWRQLTPERKQPDSDSAWLCLLEEYPTLIRRPLVMRDACVLGAGFSDARFKQFFDLERSVP